MARFLEQVFCLSSYLALIGLSSLLLYRIASHFMVVRPKWWWRCILGLTFGCASGMVIWIGDPNLLYTLPFFFFFSLLCTEGDFVGRLAVTAIFFCIIMPICALLDTYLLNVLWNSYSAYNILTRLARPAAFALLYLLLHRRMSQETVSLPRQLWTLILGLSLLPLFAMMAEVLLSYPKWESSMAHTMALSQGMVILPFTCITAVILLFVILTLADHEQLEQEVHLAGLREIYYQGLQREHNQVCMLRHDLRNHITVVQGLLERGDTEKGMNYLEQLSNSSSLGGSATLCDNETANAVLAAKAQEMQQRGLHGTFQVTLPQNLPIGEIDLCALLGNALDNAMEAAEKGLNKTITVRCQANKGLFMLQVENALAGDEMPSLSTTKKDKSAHGFGLPGMREIAKRYGGSLEVTVSNGRFELIVCLPL